MSTSIGGASIGGAGTLHNMLVENTPQKLLVAWLRLR
jgi:hypothetical protein